MISVRRSFAGKILAGLLGTVGLLLVVAYAVVRFETGRQILAVTERATVGATEQFREREAVERRQVERIARTFTEGRRAMAALDDAIKSKDRLWITGLAEYELELAQLEDLLLAFTDAAGQPVLTMFGHSALEDADPAGLAPVAQTLLESGAFELKSYRVLDGVLYSVSTRVIELARRPIGTLSLGLSVTDQDVASVGNLVGVEVCFVLDGRCVVGTPRARDGLAAALVAAGGSVSPSQIRVGGSTWSVRALPLVPDDPERGWSVVAVPLDEVVAPFDRIRRALTVAGLLALALALVVGVALSRGLSRPVRALVAATQRVAEGDYESEVAVDSVDEMGTLAGAFNDMTHGLLLKERYRSVLNLVVSTDVAQELMEGGVELGGETRDVAVLFADIRGFTALTEGMAPQEVIGLLNECMELLSDAVEAEGGVVDKYVGDELMAVFGAPVSRGDDALRAVRAAVRMRNELGGLNRDRSARGEAPLGLGVGISSGIAVAGNMGSKRRLNYTVLGETVNLGARLCSGARAGEILVSAAALRDAGSSVVAQAAGERSFKGFSKEVEVFAVEDVHAQPAETRGSTRGPAIASLVLASLVAPPGAGAQAWPTLQDAGVEYISPSGSVQVSFSGRLDLEILGFQGTTSGLAYGGDRGTLLAPRARLFTDVFLGDHVYSLVELRGDRGPAPRSGEAEARVDQAFVRLSDSRGKISIQIGRFASPFGSYALRHLSQSDPFVRPPLAYDYRTVMSRNTVPMGESGFATWKWNPEAHRAEGAPPVWDVPYQWGAMLAGASGPLAWRVAAMNSAPSSEPDAWGWDPKRMKHPSWVAGLGLHLLPSLSVGASWNKGPWLEEIDRVEAVGAYPRTRWDYDQELFAVDVTLARGPLTARAEWIHDRWEVPDMTYDPGEVGYSLELQVDVAAGWSVAARAGLLDFGTLGTVVGGGAGEEWDHDVARYEASLGYRLARNAGILGAVSTTRAGAGPGLEEDLWALRLWWAF